MESARIQGFIYQAIDMVNNIREESQLIPKTPDTELYSKDGHLDSMGLVGFLIDVEELFLDEDIEISLSDEKAMSQKNSPFKSVDTLTKYIHELISEETK